MIRQLSFDTSTANIHLALLEDRKVLFEQVVEIDKAAVSGDRQEIANSLIPTMQQALSTVGWTRCDLDCIIVGSGPGGFTGIRTGVVTARALAQALALPLIAVSSLESICSQLPVDSGLLLFATTAHFYAAKKVGAELSSEYLSLASLSDFLQGKESVFADIRTIRELESLGSKSLPTGDAALTPPTILPLAEPSNMAVVQAAVAWPRLSLKVEAICERLNYEVTHLGAADGQSKLLVRKELALEFRYDDVLPTYLRAPSITLKKTNV